MTKVQVQLLGTFAVQIEAVPVVHFRSDKVRALLAYLAVEADRPYPRAHLATLLWPDQGDTLALRNLSQTLVHLRTALGDGTATPPVLQITRQTIQWNGQHRAEIDVTTFTRLARSTAIDEIHQAAVLYRGPFLTGFHVSGCPEFDDWLMLTREQMERLAVAMLDTLAQTYLAAGSYTEAEGAARRLLALDPWREAAHRQVMAALAGAGQRSAALAQYAACARTLAEEQASSRTRRQPRCMRRSNRVVGKRRTPGYRRAIPLRLTKRLHHLPKP